MTKTVAASLARQQSGSGPGRGPWCVRRSRVDGLALKPMPGKCLARANPPPLVSAAVPFASAFLRGPGAVASAGLCTSITGGRADAGTEAGAAEATTFEDHGSNAGPACHGIGDRRRWRLDSKD